MFAEASEKKTQKTEKSKKKFDRGPPYFENPEIGPTRSERPACERQDAAGRTNPFFAIIGYPRGGQNVKIKRDSLFTIKKIRNSNFSDWQYSTLL